MKNKNNADYKYKFMIIAVLLSYIFYCLFYFQATTTNETFDSDTQAHIQFACLQTGDYSLLHKTVYILTETIRPLERSPIHVSMLTMPIVLALSIFFSILILHHYFCLKYPHKSHYLTSFLPIALIFVSMIIYNPYKTYLFISSSSPNIWHNPTIIFSRTFAILTFLYVLKIYYKYKSKKTYLKEFLLLLLFSTLSMWAKPSFLTSFLPSVAILFIYQYFKKKISLKFLFAVALSLVPSFILSFIIQSSVFDDKSYVVFAFAKVWRSFSTNIPLSILQASAFPLYIFLINIKRLSFPFILSFINYIISLLLYLCLAEHGNRLLHGNMGWGYILGMFFLFVFASEEFFLKRQYSLSQKITGWILFMMHFLSGVFYFIKILSGGRYL